ncbi:MAG: amino acid permease [Candidatus Eremiobacteraeota bacterium]|nr:amino acid permease [Candidatus Eremiobacteraeota bacterium]MBC5802937.1 amino acid permease [Candidatus Eremiobacteraeota bacterium]MBC5822252.1 amino acid permease [Candidatus Eremiobacteraeota bacterium]
MGGVIGAGIFRAPSVVAARAHGATPILVAWLFGGLVALIGAFVFAELAWRRPSSGGLYGYLRDAYHPVVAFMYGWTALLISQSGGMAAAAITFGAYVAPAANAGAAALWGVAAIAILTVINCLGVREGGTAQNLLMILKGAVIVALIAAGAFVAPATAAGAVSSGAFTPPPSLLIAFGAAMIPVLYAYDGFQTAAFVDGELKDPKRTLPFGLVWGIAAVVALYVGVTLVGLRVLGPHGLADTATPASDIMRLAFGATGARIIALGIALSTLGFLSNQILTSPRIYYAMAQDRIFFKQLAWVHPRSRVPLVAIVVQSLVAIVIALSGRYDQILNYVTSIDFVFLGLAAGAVIVFRRRARAASRSEIAARAADAAGIRIPGHPWTTVFFIVVSVAVVVNTYIAFPNDSLIGLAILLLGAPVYLIWKRPALHR